MQRQTLVIALGVAMLTVASSLCATEKLYQWTDANGVTHYSDLPPAKGTYQDRRIQASDQVALVSAEITSAPVENPRCTSARANLALLASSQPLRQDSDNDGKADKVLSEKERSDQKVLAEAMAKINCSSELPEA